MTTYPVEFHRRLEQKWESRIDQFSRLRVQCPHRDVPMMTMMMGMQTVSKSIGESLGWRRPEGTYNDRHFIEAAAFPDVTEKEEIACP